MNQTHTHRSAVRRAARHRIARLGITAAIAVSSLTAATGHASAADAAGPPPESGLQCVDMDPNACWAHQVVFRGDPMMEFYNWTKKKWPDGFNYNHNGCSVQQAIDEIEDNPLLPDSLIAVIDAYADYFRASCNIHDFGYRNFGSGTQAGYKQYRVNSDFLTENQKSWNEPNGKLTIDHRFGDLMDRQCENGDPPGTVATCKLASWAFELAVRKRGRIDG